MSKYQSAIVDRDIAPALAALNEFIKKTRTAKDAARVLKAAGILDKKGRLHKRYRS